MSGRELNLGFDPDQPIRITPRSEVIELPPIVVTPEDEKPPEIGPKPNGFPRPGAGGNTQGIIVPQTAIAEGDDEAPPFEAETEAEGAWYDFITNGTRDAAQFYQENISAGLHDLANQSMDTGGDLLITGGVTTAVGGVMTATGIGAVAGAPTAAAGVTIATAGGILSGIGAALAGAATGLDALADRLINGASFDVAAGAIDGVIDLGTNLLERLLFRWVPGRGGGRGSRSESDRGKGGYVTGKNDPRCKLLPYNKNDKGRCPAPFTTPHHVVPDHVFKPRGGGPRYTGAPTHGQGLTICVDGKDKRTGRDGSQLKRGNFLTDNDYYDALATHGRLHLKVDLYELALGAAGSPQATTRLDAMEKAAARAVAKEVGCDEKDIERQLRDYHSDTPFNLPPDTLVRADPWAAYPNPPANIMGRPDINPGGGTLE